MKEKKLSEKETIEKMSQLAKNRKGTDLSNALKKYGEDKLDFSNQGLGMTGAKILSNALNNYSNLTKLNLYDNKLNDKPNKSLIPVLTQLISLKNLTWLSLQKNSIDDAGAKAIADQLPTNKYLTYLNVAENNITDNGARALFAALCDNTALIALDLTNNRGELLLKNINKLLGKNSIIQELIKEKQNLEIKAGAPELAKTPPVSENSDLEKLNKGLEVRLKLMQAKLQEAELKLGKEIIKNLEEKKESAAQAQIKAQKKVEEQAELQLSFQDQIKELKQQLAAGEKFKDNFSDSTIGAGGETEEEVVLGGNMSDTDG